MSKLQHFVLGGAVVRGVVPSCSALLGCLLPYALLGCLLPYALVGCLLPYALLGCLLPCKPARLDHSRVELRNARTGCMLSSRRSSQCMQTYVHLRRGSQNWHGEGTILSSPTLRAPRAKTSIGTDALDCNHSSVRYIRCGRRRVEVRDTWRVAVCSDQGVRVPLVVAGLA